MFLCCFIFIYFSHSCPPKYVYLLMSLSSLSFQKWKFHTGRDILSSLFFNAIAQNPECCLTLPRDSGKFCGMMMIVTCDIYSCLFLNYMCLGKNKFFFCFYFHHFSITTSTPLHMHCWVNLIQGYLRQSLRCIFKFNFVGVIGCLLISE